MLIADDPSGRTDIRAVMALLADERYLSLMVEAGSKVNWAFLDSGVADKIFFYYAPKILGGLESLPVAGGIGRRRRADAILLERCERAHHQQRRIRGRGVGHERSAGAVADVRADTHFMFTGIVQELGKIAGLRAA